MFKRWLLLLTLGVLVTFAAVTRVDAACCGTGCGCGGYAAPMAMQPQYAPPVYQQPMYQQPMYQQPVYQQSYAHSCCAQQPVYQPVAQSCCGQQTYASPCGRGPSLFGGLFGQTNNYSCGVSQPVPVYVVNQGPVYSGPNIAVAPAPYSYSYNDAQPYPYVPSTYYSGGYNGAPYANPIRRRVYRYHRYYQRHAYRGRVLRRRD